MSRAVPPPLELTDRALTEARQQGAGLPAADAAGCAPLAALDRAAVREGDSVTEQEKKKAM
eukprot:gene50514-63501_t